MGETKRYYSYGEKEIKALSKKDPLLGQAMKEIGMIQREVRPDLFSSLISSIVSQQISNKAFTTVWSRILTAVGPITPKNILSIGRDELKACGLSYKKTDWIQSIAQAVHDGSFDLERLSTLTDDAIIRELITLPGIGKWTAEMLLIFSLERPDVLSYGDLAIRRGIQKLYGLESLSKDEFEVIRQRLSPYNTVASLYFWELSRTD